VALSRSTQECVWKFFTLHLQFAFGYGCDHSSYVSGAHGVGKGINPASHFKILFKSFNCGLLGWPALFSHE
jgi:hypothetical protein